MTGEVESGAGHGGDAYPGNGGDLVGMQAFVADDEPRLAASAGDDLDGDIGRNPVGAVQRGCGHTGDDCTGCGQHQTGQSISQR